MDHRTPPARRQVFADYYCPIEAGYKDRSGVLPYDSAVCRALTSTYRKPKEVKGSEERTLFVARLPQETEEADLEKAFGRYGALQETRLVRDMVTGAPRGYAFVVFARRRDAAAARAACRRLCIGGADVVVEAEFSRGLPGWRPRRLGGGLGGKKESGQLRFGGSARPFIVDCPGPAGAGRGGPQLRRTQRDDRTVDGAGPDDSAVGGTCRDGPDPAAGWAHRDDTAAGHSERGGSVVSRSHRDISVVGRSRREEPTADRSTESRAGRVHGERDGPDRGPQRRHRAQLEPGEVSAEGASEVLTQRTDGATEEPGRGTDSGDERRHRDRRRSGSPGHRRHSHRHKSRDNDGEGRRRHSHKHKDKDSDKHKDKHKDRHKDKHKDKYKDRERKDEGDGHRSRKHHRVR